MLASLLYRLLEHYIEYTNKRNWVAYATQFFFFLAVILLIVANYMYFTVPEKTIFSLVAAGCCFVISVILFCLNLGIKRYRKNKFIKPFVDKIYLFESVLEKIRAIEKVVDVRKYRRFIIWGMALIVILIVRRYLKNLKK